MPTDQTCLAFPSGLCRNRCCSPCSSSSSDCTWCRRGGCWPKTRTGRIWTRRPWRSAFWPWRRWRSENPENKRPGRVRPDPIPHLRRKETTEMKPTWVVVKTQKRMLKRRLASPDEMRTRNPRVHDRPSTTANEKLVRNFFHADERLVLENKRPYQRIRWWYSALRWQDV